MTRGSRSHFLLGVIAGACLGGAGVYVFSGLDAESAVARRVGAVELERGEGRITGSVVNVKGEPVEGVRITLKRTLTWGEGSPAPPGTVPDLTLEAELRRFVERRRSELARTRVLTSDSKGRFVFDGLPSGAFTVEGHGEGLTVERAVTEVVRDGDELEFTARRLGRVPVKIIAPASIDPANVTFVRIKTPPKGSKYTRQGTGVRRQQGVDYVDLPEGEHILVATHTKRTMGEYDTVESEGRAVVVKGGETAAPVEFHLAARTCIRGRVKGADSEDVPQAIVYCMENPREREPDLAFLRANGRQVMASPEYQLADLKPGTYLLGVGVGWMGPIEVTKFVDLTQGATLRLDFTLPPPRETENFVLHLRKSGDSPLTEPRAKFHVEEEPRVSLDLTLKPLSKGFAFEIPEALRERLLRRDPPPPAATLTIQALYHGSVKVPFDVRKREIEVDLPKTTTLTVRVPDYRGSGREGLLTVQVSEPGSQSWSLQRMDADGMAKFHYLTPGAYELRMMLSTPTTASPYESTMLTTRTVEVPPDGAEVTLTLPPASGGK